jgi:RecB family exonuclease
MAAAVELPRRLATARGALAGVYPFKVLDLARARAEPVLLGRGLRAWDNGHDALVASRLLAEAGAAFGLPPELPRRPVATTLARTLRALRQGRIPPERVEIFAAAPGTARGDAERLRTLAGLYRGFHESLEARTADPPVVLEAAARGLVEAGWMAEAEVLIVDDLELDPVERDFVAALARILPVRILKREQPSGLRPSSFRGWAEEHGVAEVDRAETSLAPLAPPPAPDGLVRLRRQLFEPPAGDSIDDGAVTFVSAPGEAAEVRALARRLLTEASRGVPFEEMGVILPRPDTYAPLFTDLLERLGVPHRLHPSLPLRFGRGARALLLLFRCRGLARATVMEFLTFAPVPFAELLGEGADAQPPRWDAISRDAGIVSGLDRWMIGLRAYAEAEGEAAEKEGEERRARRKRRVHDAEALLRVVELLSATLDTLSGSELWPVWSERLHTVCAQWIGPTRDRESLSGVVADLASLGSLSSRASWEEVEQVLEARLDWERLPLEPVEGGAVHVGALDAMAGLPFRVVAVPGLVEGGYPGVLRPDPFLLDDEREALAGGHEPTPGPPVDVPEPPKPRPSGQMSLFDDEGQVTLETPRRADAEAPLRRPRGSEFPVLPTTQDRLLEARRLFHRAVSQATERLVLSYPRADARTGRERLPSLFFAAAASTLAGRPLAGADLDRLVVEEEPATLPLEEALDAGERDRTRVQTGERAAAEAIAAGSVHFKQSRLAAQARWSGRLTRYDGFLSDLPDAVVARIDPLRRTRAMSASRLAVYSRCGFQYLLEHVLHLEAALEPEERRRIDPLERGTLFHDVAERFLRERRDRGELPLENSPENRSRLLEMAGEGLDRIVAGSPPRFTLLWEREKRSFRKCALTWLEREAAHGKRSTPAHFEVGFGLGERPEGGEPHDPEPIEIPLDEDRALRVSGKIDRIDRRKDGLVLRDYKTGRAPRDDGRVFRGGRQLQIPFYILATEKILPEEKVQEAFLDYVDAGRQVAFSPSVARSDAFRDLLASLVDLIAGGVFVQEPAACEWCDFTAVCGPRGLLQRRQQIKIRDKNLQAYLRLRDVV